MTLRAFFLPSRALTTILNDPVSNFSAFSGTDGQIDPLDDFERALSPFTGTNDPSRKKYPDPQKNRGMFI
jgi:hypothetical protein